MCDKEFALLKLFRSTISREFSHFIIQRNRIYSAESKLLPFAISRDLLGEIFQKASETMIMLDYGPFLRCNIINLAWFIEKTNFSVCLFACVHCEKINEKVFVSPEMNMNPFQPFSSSSFLISI